MKIVLTMTLEASSADHAEALASHIAAFVPDDADRVTDAFSALLGCGTSGAPHSLSARPRPRQATHAEVIAVIPAAAPVSPG
ncbi:MAG: hypothetical protein H7Z41_19460 [Cytophagales bacterium]|nr:hypothetical protein [Armatimonadota bacterium]